MNSCSIGYYITFHGFLKPQIPLVIFPQNAKIPLMKQRVAIIGKKPLFSLLLQNAFKVPAFGSEGFYS